MGERDTQSLEGLSEAEAPKTATVREEARVTLPVLVDINYPDPTLLSQVIRDVAKWSGQSFVMEPSLNAKIQIFAPKRQKPAQAYELFLASLSVVNLRAVQVGSVVKIVPAGLPVSA